MSDQQAQPAPVSTSTNPAAAVLALIGHVWWYARGGPGGEVVSGFGATLIAIALVLVGAGYLSPQAINSATSSLMPQDRRSFAMPTDPAYDAALKRAWVEIRAGVIKERIVAAFLIAIGTVLNGYGPILARGLEHIYKLHMRSIGHG